MRREFISIAGASIILPSEVIAQTVSRRAVVAFLHGASQAATLPRVERFLRGLREQGFIEGQNLSVVIRFLDGDMNRLPAHVLELIALKPDVLVAGSTNIAVAFKQQTSVIPIVAMALTDPIGQGLIDSLARPGGNVTGVLYTVQGLPGKMLQLLLEIKPGLKRVGLLVAANNVGGFLQAADAEAAAASLGVTLVRVEINSHDDFSTAFQALIQARIEAVLATSATLILAERSDFAARALAAGLATICTYPEVVEAGGLMSYGIDFKESYGRSGYFVGRILKGEKPSDLIYAVS